MTFTPVQVSRVLRALEDIQIPHLRLINQFTLSEALFWSADVMLSSMALVGLIAVYQMYSLDGVPEWLFPFHPIDFEALDPKTGAYDHLDPPAAAARSSGGSHGV